MEMRAEGIVCAIRKNGINVGCSPIKKVRGIRVLYGQPYMTTDLYR